MNLNFRKTALLAGICSVFSLGYTPQLFAVSSVDTVEAVQQTKKITGVVSDAMGPIIGANVLEKGTTNGVITDIDGNFCLECETGSYHRGFLYRLCQPGNKDNGPDNGEHHVEGRL